MQTQFTQNDPKLLQAACVLARAYQKHSWNDVAAEDFVQEYLLARHENGVDLDSWAKAQHYKIKSWRDVNNKLRVRGAISMTRADADGKPIEDALVAPEPDESIITQPNIQKLTDYQKRIFEFVLSPKHTK